MARTGARERYDPVQLAALSARSFRDAVERSSRYKQLTCPEEIRLVERGNECAIKFVWLLAHEQEPPLLTDACFAWIVSLGQRGTGRALHPKKVEFQRALTHREMYEGHFRCPVKFKAKQNPSSLIPQTSISRLSLTTLICWRQSHRSLRQN